MRAPLRYRRRSMPALRGSLTYARFFVEGELPDDFRERFMRAIRLRAMKPLAADEDDLERSGWCRVGDPFELELGYEEVFYNEFLNLGFRTDRWVIPGPMLRAKMREAEAAYLAKKGRERMSRNEKAELKEVVSRRLRKQLSPAVRAFDLVVTRGRDRALLQPVAARGAMMTELFTKTFGLKLVPEAPYTLAARLGMSKAQETHWQDPSPRSWGAMTEERGMPLVDRIEKRRFVGHEFLLWLWMESELFEGTLETKEHGAFGLWIERQMCSRRGRRRSRASRAATPRARGRRRSPLAGKVPEPRASTCPSAGRTRASSSRRTDGALGLKLPTVLGREEDAAPEAAPRPPPRRRGSRSREAEALEESDEQHEAFYERMRLTREIEELLEALYRDFLELRLSPAWDAVVLPALRAWADPDGEPDADRYRAARAKATSGRKAARGRG